MPEDALETLTARVAELERKLSAAPKPADWRSIVGMFPDDEFTRAWAAEVEAAREADRAAASANPTEDDV